MPFFRKKPVRIEAVQLRWDTWDEMCEFANVGMLTNRQPEGAYGPDGSMNLLIPTLEGTMTAQENDWIIKGVKGELYPCKPDIFEATYEPAEPEPNWSEESKKRLEHLRQLSKEDALYNDDSSFL